MNAQLQYTIKQATEGLELIAHQNHRAWQGGAANAALSAIQQLQAEIAQYKAMHSDHLPDAAKMVDHVPDAGKTIHSPDDALRQQVIDTLSAVGLPGMLISGEESHRALCTLLKVAGGE